MSNPTLFRTEAISKLSEAVKNIRSTQQTLQSSSPVRSKVYDITNYTTNYDFWIGSVKLVQDQLGVFVILNVGNISDKGGNGQALKNALESILLPISLNTESEVYELVVNLGSRYRIGCDHKLELRLLRIGDSDLRLSLAYDISVESYGLHSTCIYGLIPDAILNEELPPQH